MATLPEQWHVHLKDSLLQEGLGYHATSLETGRVTHHAAGSTVNKSSTSVSNQF
jgi:hypothetical protein